MNKEFAARVAKLDLDTKALEAKVKELEAMPNNVRKYLEGLRLDELKKELQAEATELAKLAAKGEVFFQE